MAFWTVVDHIGFAVSILGNIALVLALRRTKETRIIEPQPFDVRVIDAMAKEKDCLSRFELAQRELEAIRQRRDADIAAGSISRKAIYETITQTNRETTKQLESVRSELSAQISTMPDRIIATLRNVGAIGRPGL
jgi:hypothetical protein